MSFVRLTQMQAIILQRISVYFVSFYILSLGMEEEVTEKYVLLEENLERGEKKEADNKKKKEEDKAAGEMIRQQVE